MTELAVVRDLMERFASRTGVGRGGTRRYLWTDAFAVCNFLGVAGATGEGRYAELALCLIDDVHRVLGRRRADDVRHGWISGLPEDEGRAHPTRGGLRIGKPICERRPGEPFDERREWDRDGQYFHYLTKWMHALDQSSRALHLPLFNEWACDLVRAAHRAFTYDAGGRRRMYWKVSTDLARPLVSSMGQHDPLDGFVTCLELDATREAMAVPGPSLDELAADFGGMIDRAALPTADPLGIGGLLADAHRLAQLGPHAARAGLADLQRVLIEAASVGVEAYAARGELGTPAAQRLAFRELGLAIGLRAVGETLPGHVPLGSEEIVSFWLRPEHRATPAWVTHEDINDVMLATALLPDGFLRLWPAARS